MIERYDSGKSITYYMVKNLRKQYAKDLLAAMPEKLVEMAS